MDGLYPILRPQQPVRPFWMGDCEDNERWEVIQGDVLAYFIEMFCDCPTLTPDITDYIFQFTVKGSMDPLDPNELLTVIWNEQHGGCGWTALIVMPAQTGALPQGRYAFDLKNRSPGGIVQTMKRGELDVLATTNIDLSPPIPVINPLPAMIKTVNRQSAQARLIG